MSRRTYLAALAAMALALPLQARAQYQVFVGYADGLRGPVTFPNPWAGSAGVQHFIGYSGLNPDAGGIMIRNSGAAAITLNNVFVNIGGVTYDFAGLGHIPGAGLVIDPGMVAILTGQNNGGDFDTSDFHATQPCGVVGGDIPLVTATVNGAATNYNDTGRILNTGGFDSVCQGNESLGWRLIGTTGINNPGNQLPEPGTNVMIATGAVALGLIARRRRSA